jgi:hypothetical protein
MAGSVSDRRLDGCGHASEEAWVIPEIIRNGFSNDDHRT